MGDSVLVLFFSSRRRHTIFDCDWSSDVCSSDLGAPGQFLAVGRELRAAVRRLVVLRQVLRLALAVGGHAPQVVVGAPRLVDLRRGGEVGRGAGRGRGEGLVVAGSIKKKKDIRAG